MSDTTAQRSRPLVWVALLMSTLLGMALAFGVLSARADATSQAAHHGAAAMGPPSAARNAFQDEMRRLWEDHITWTRLAIVTFADGSAGFASTADRLLQNQRDIGDAIRPFYGDAAGDRLTDLLTEHITIAVDVLQAAEAGDSGAQDDATTRWYLNADEVAHFLATANPQSWPEDLMRTAMRTHLDQTLSEATHELQGQYAASIADYEEVHAHILMMADTLSAGITAQFPSRFR